MAWGIARDGEVGEFLHRSLFFGGITLLAAAVMLGLAPAARADSYTVAGLHWGSGPAEAAKALRKEGFKVSKPYSGPATEYVRMDQWLDIQKVDRGKRMTANGEYLGQKVELDLVFGHNDELERVFMHTPLWDGTIKGGKRMTATAQKLLAHFEREFGPADHKENPYGWTDTARWSRASDGSRLEMYIRGTEGFMFYPGHKTALTFNFSNPRYSSDVPALASTRNGGAKPFLVNDREIPSGDGAGDLR